MSYQESFDGRTLAISVSDSPDIAALGLSKQHLEDAMVEIARHMLALGARLAYGGDLRTGGFSELLFELVARHRPDTIDATSVTGVYSYLAWPVHIGMSFDELLKAKEDLGGVAELICLDLDGARMPMDTRQHLPRQAASPAEWARGLTAMRRTRLDESDARVLLGGQIAGFKGTLPGLAEEALMSLAEKRPLYLLGGFGGCARDIAESVGLAPSWPGSRGDWPGRTSFKQFNPGDLHCGLARRENETLAKTPHIDQAIILMMRGLRSVWA